MTEPHLIEWLKLAASISTPLVLFFIGLLAKRYADRAEGRKARSAVAAEWRLEVFRAFLPALNHLYCYYTYQGDWRMMSPEDARNKKRECDRIFHMNCFLWSDECRRAYAAFIKGAFKENRGPGEEFLLKANVERHQENPGWQDNWKLCFVSSDQRIERKDFVKLYDEFLARAVTDLGILEKS